MAGPPKRSADQVKAKDGAPVAWASARLLALVLVVYYAAMMVMMERRLHWQPAVLPASAPAQLFSEERALQHVQALAAELPDRQISMPQLRRAHDYVEAQGRALAELAGARGGDVDVQVHRELVTGSVSMDFGGVPFTNAYNGLTNIVVTITPKAAAGRRGLLIAAHHDSAVTSPGAADDVSMVAVMLEGARALLSRPRLPPVPLVLLFDGGEESICQAGHGFFNSSPHARNLGAFVNLEAMGGGGLPILFQHTGAWTVAAWARGAPNAHGARIAQDIFDTGLIPGDTDYRMFSARHYGSLPGLDVAFIRDSVAYHTDLDAPDRLRPGALQDMGQALLGGALALADDLAADEGVGKLATREALMERSVYFDLIGAGMVAYSDSTARLLHATPLALHVLLPLMAVGGGHSPPAVMRRMMGGAGRAALSFVGALAAPAALGVARVLVTGVSMVWFAQHWVAYATFLPLGLAAALAPWLRLREEAAAAQPWQQGHFVACQVYGVGVVLSALAAALCAAGLQGFSQILAMGGGLAFVVGNVLDGGQKQFSLLNVFGVLAVCTAPLWAMGAILGTFLDVMMERMAITGHHSVLLADGLIGVLTGSAVLGYSCCCLLPLAAYALGGLAEAPLQLPDAPGRRLRRRGWASAGGVLVAALVAASLAMAAWSSYGPPPYDAASPRRVTITHLVETGDWVPEDDVFPAAAARAVAAAVAASEVHPRAGAEAGGGAAQEAPPSPAEERRALAAQLSPPPSLSAKLALGITDSNTWAQMFPQPQHPATLLPRAAAAPEGADGAASVRYNAALPYEFASLYPLDRLLGTAVVDGVAPPAEPLVAVPPYIRLLRDDLLPPPAAAPAPPGPTRRLHLRLFSEAACWGMVNITSAAPLRGWSLPSAPVAAPLGTQRPGGPPGGYFHMVRFSHEAASPFWDVWIDVDLSGPGGGAVVVELSATYLPLTPELRAVRAGLPGWVSPTWAGTTYHTRRTF